jgi:hypothetical protein
MLAWAVGLLVHSGAVMIGARATKQEQVNFIQCVVVALVSYATMFLVGFLLTPLMWIPIVNLFVKAAVIWLGTAAAAKFILNLDWKPALSLGGVVAVIQFVLGLIFH